MSRTFFLTQTGLAETAAALLVLSFGAGCGDSGGATGDAGSGSDGSPSTDARGSRDQGTPPGPDGATEAGGGDARVDDGAPSDASEAGDAVASPLAVDLGTAGHFAILAKSGISTVPTSAVTGDLGVSPAAASYITGFALTADPTNVFATSTQVTGKVYASNYKPPTPSNLTTAVGDMQTAFTDAAGRPAGVTGLGAGNIGGMTLSPGVYKWGTGLLVPTDVTLAGDATAVWIFQIAKSLTVSNGSHVVLSGGALPKNVFWQVAGAVDLGTTSHFEGIVLGKTAITVKTGASVTGRLLAQTAVSLEGSTVVEPAL